MNTTQRLTWMTLAVTACALTAGCNRAPRPDNPVPQTLRFDGIGLSDGFEQAEGLGITVDGEPVIGMTVIEITEVDGEPVGIEIEDSTGNRFRIDATNGTVSLEDGVIVAETTVMTGRDRLRIADPATAEFEHQTFGAWITNLGSDVDPRGRIGSGSAGTATEVLPATAPAARYAGTSLGIVSLTGTGELLETASDITVDVTENFSTVQLRSFNTRVTSSLNGDTAPQEAIGLDFETNEIGLEGPEFSATYSDDREVPLTGEVRGRFYGPNGEEVGGIFEASDAEFFDYIGAFGARNTGMPPPLDPDAF